MYTVGKTTTISILTGLIESSAGDVSIYGRSLADNLSLIRQDMGICPQINVLFNKLTVYEHLQFFGNIKGMYGSALKKHIEDVVTEIGLCEKINTVSSALSGGVKRKL